MYSIEKPTNNIEKTSETKLSTLFIVVMSTTHQQAAVSICLLRVNQYSLAQIHYSASYSRWGILYSSSTEVWNFAACASRFAHLKSILSGQNWSKYRRNVTTKDHLIDTYCKYTATLSQETSSEMAKEHLRVTINANQIMRINSSTRSKASIWNSAIVNDVVKTIGHKVVESIDITAYIEERDALDFVSNK